MGSALPPELAALLDGQDLAAHRGAWPAFLTRYNRLLLKGAGSFGGDYDARMDRYRYMLEALGADDYRRLRAYHSQSRSSFPAWLTVVARRLCVDFDRGRVGRADRASDRVSNARRLRRGLLDLTGEPADPDTLPDTREDPSGQVESEERRSAVEHVLGELPPRDQLLLRLRYEDGLSVREIADVMGFATVFHVYRRLRPLLDQLRRRLTPYGPTHAAE